MTEPTEKTTPENILFFTVHKAASMFIYKVCQDLSKRIGLKYYSVNHNRLNRYYFDTEESDLADIRNWEGRTGCFAPLRYFFEIPKELNASIILHLRDPRDVLVSLYYSEAFSHNVIRGVFELGRSERDEIRSLGIDRYVLMKADEFNEKYQDYLSLLARPNAVFVKYEDMVLNFSRWLDQVAQAFGVKDADFIERIYKKYKNDFEIKKENIHAHKRKITPGDYKEKLKQQTIMELNDTFKNTLESYGYI